MPEITPEDNYAFGFWFVVFCIVKTYALQQLGTRRHGEVWRINFLAI